MKKVSIVSLVVLLLLSAVFPIAQPTITANNDRPISQVSVFKHSDMTQSYHSSADQKHARPSNHNTTGKSEPLAYARTNFHLANWFFLAVSLCGLFISIYTLKQKKKIYWNVFVPFWFFTVVSIFSGWTPTIFAIAIAIAVLTIVRSCIGKKKTKQLNSATSTDIDRLFGHPPCSSTVNTKQQFSQPNLTFDLPAFIIEVFEQEKFNYFEQDLEQSKALAQSFAEKNTSLNSLELQNRIRTVLCSYARYVTHMRSGKSDNEHIAATKISTNSTPTTSSGFATNAGSFCTSCGADNQLNHSYCDHCGAPIK